MPNIERWMGEISQELKHIREELQESKGERKAHTEKSWKEMNKITDKLYNHDTEIKVMKGKAGMIAIVISFAMGVITFIVNLWWKMKS